MEYRRFARDQATMYDEDCFQPNDLQTERDVLGMRLLGQWPTRWWPSIDDKGEPFAQPVHAALARALADETFLGSELDVMGLVDRVHMILDEDGHEPLDEADLRDRLRNMMVAVSEGVRIEDLLHRLLRMARTREFRRALLLEAAHLADREMYPELMRHSLERLLAATMPPEEDSGGFPDLAVEGRDVVLEVFRKLHRSSVLDADPREAEVEGDRTLPTGLPQVTRGGDGLRPGDVVYVQAESHELARLFVVRLLWGVITHRPADAARRSLPPIFVASGEEGPISLIEELMLSFSGELGIHRMDEIRSDEDLRKVLVRAECLSNAGIWVSTDARAGWQFADAALGRFDRLLDHSCTGASDADIKSLVILDRVPRGPCSRREMPRVLACGDRTSRSVVVVLDTQGPPSGDAWTSVSAIVERPTPSKMRVTWRRNEGPTITDELELRGRGV